MDGVMLSWALVDGSIVRAGESASGLRARCPECGFEVSNRRGEVRKPHFAHLPGAGVCVFRSGDPESQLHRSVKLYLAEQLRSAMAGETITLERRCAGAAQAELFFGGPDELFGGSCPESSAKAIAVTWDEVEVEGEVPAALGCAPRRADVLLRRRGRPLIAVEVHVQHRVDAQKAFDLEAGGVLWLEVHASLTDTSLLAWTPDRPLPVASLPAGVEWRCPDHALVRGAEHFKFVDLFMPPDEGGKPRWERLVYWVEGLYRFEPEVERRRKVGARICRGLKAVARDRERIDLDNVGGGDHMKAHLQRVQEQVGPDVYVRPVSAWHSVAHLPVAERMQVIAMKALDLASFPLGMRWEEEQRGWVAVERSRGSGIDWSLQPAPSDVLAAMVRYARGGVPVLPRFLETLTKTTPPVWSLQAQAEEQGFHAGAVLGMVQAGTARHELNGGEAADWLQPLDVELLQGWKPEARRQFGLLLEALAQRHRGDS